MGLLWAILPDEMMPLVVVGLGLALIVGLVSRKTALAIVITIVLFLLLRPIISALIALLPYWALLLVAAWFALYLFRSMLGLLLGAEGAGTAVGHVFGHFILALLRLPFRLVGAVFRLARPAARIR